jgi:hypothetical protein
MSQSHQRLIGQQKLNSMKSPSAKSFSFFTNHFFLDFFAEYLDIFNRCNVLYKFGRFFYQVAFLVRNGPINGFARATKNSDFSRDLIHIEISKLNNIVRFIV